MFFRFLRPILCLALLWCAVDAFTQKKMIMVTEAWPPYRIDNPVVPDGLTGIDIDLVVLLGKELGFTVEIQRHPWSRDLEMIKDGQADFITGLAYNPERAVYCLYVPTSYSAVQPVLYVKKGKASTVRSYADIAGKTIAQSKDSVYFEPYNSDTRLNKIRLSDETQILQMLSLGRVDLAVGTDPNISWDVARLGLRDVLEATEYRPPDRTDLFIAFSRRSKYTEMIPQFDAAIRKMLADGTIEKILARYR